MSHAHREHAVMCVPFLPSLPKLPLGRSHRPILRHRRRSFRPDADTGPYRLPKALQERLTADLAPFRNAETAYALAVFLGRYWSSEARLEDAFPIDRRALSNHKDLDLTEARVRGAIETLERIGFLERAVSPKGSVYRLTEDGLRRKATLYLFGDSYRAAFRAANKRPRRQDQKTHRSGSINETLPSRPAVRQSHQQSWRPSVSALAPATISPKNNNSFEESVIMGELAIKPQFQQEHSRLEDAIDRLRRAGNFE